VTEERVCYNSLNTNNLSGKLSPYIKPVTQYIVVTLSRKFRPRRRFTGELQFSKKVTTSLKPAISLEYAALRKLMTTQKKAVTA
jgi:hypothetical protein